MALSKSRSSGTHLDLGAYIRRYQDFNEFNFSTYLLGIGHNRTVKNWQFQISVKLDSSFTIDTRDDDRLTIVVRTEYALGPGGANSEWFSFFEYRYTDNDSNFDRYGYSGSLLTFGMQILF